jgi:HlyD family secretion protein/adhesin transport system membrane fusion protein
MQHNTAFVPYSVQRQLRMLMHSFRRHYQKWFTDDVAGTSQSMVLEETHLPRLVRLSIIILSGATLCFVSWASLATVKELAHAEGQVLPSGYSQIVQHLEGGLVQEILVHEGDFVQKNQLLVRMDGAGMEEDFMEAQAQVIALALQKEQIKAILENRPPDFTGIAASPELIAEQRHMYEAAKLSQAEERSVLEEQIVQKQTNIKRLGQSYAAAQANLSTAQESSSIYDNLQQQGLVSRTNYLKKREELNTRRGDAGSLAQQIAEGKNELTEYERRRSALLASQNDAAYSELHKVESDLAQALENLKKRSDRVSRLEVRSPVTGYVKGLKLNTVGAVIPAGQTLMEIVPVDEQLIVEIRILPQQIGRVAVGQTVQVKIDSYDYVRYGTIEGKLESISAMTFSDEIRRQDYYKGRVRLQHSYAGSVPGAHPILPGMTVEGDIITGEKTVLGYLLKPIQVAMHNAMTEQ